MTTDPGFDPRRWMDDLSAALRIRFGERLLFVGLQGSCRRGEATPASDIDAVVVLDRLDMTDLAAYRAILDVMPHGERACGFVSGRAELAAWPAHELFQFRFDTESWYGDLDDFLPSLRPEDVRQGIPIAASGLYHMAGHLFLHGGDGWEEALRGIFKAAFFPIQAAHYLRRGEYVERKRDLLDLLDGDEAEIVRAGLEWPADVGASRDRLFGLILDWSAAVLRKGGFDGAE